MKTALIWRRGGSPGPACAGRGSPPAHLRCSRPLTLTPRNSSSFSSSLSLALRT